MNQLLDDLDVALNRIDEDKIINRLKELKILINKDIIIQQQLDDFAIAKDKYEHHQLDSKDFSSIKKELYSHPLMSEYFRLYSEVNLSLIRFNKRILSLLDNKQCHRI